MWHYYNALGDSNDLPVTLEVSTFYKNGADEVIFINRTIREDNF